MPRPKNNEIREQILRCAFEKFQNNDYDKVYLKDIAEDCGITKTLLHHYFPQKADIVVHIIYDMLIKIQDHMEDADKYSVIENEKTAVGYDIMMLHYMFDVLERDGANLLYMYSNILCDARLMNEIVSFCLRELRYYRDHYKTAEAKTGQYLIFGGIAQLVLLHLEGKLIYSINEGIDKLSKAQFVEQGLSPDEIESIFDLVKELDKTEKKDEFYSKYLSSMETFINCSW